MMGRVIYLVAGAALGGYVVHRLNRTTRAWSPAGIAGRVEDHVAGYRDALREFNDDVHDAMDRREAELLRRYGGEPRSPGGHALPAGPATEPLGAHGAHDVKDGR
ncbi:hypothetical protein ACFO4E_12185 [Nocardiopsis mangrovi]|uniref:YtxH domain-containing protein n=1 Tax=Nocardiopsis mangrovi TaxID=1179818 RepID=A0ABV9DUN3_9ACTN